MEASAANALLSQLDMFNNTMTCEVPQIIEGLLGKQLGAMELQSMRNSYVETDDLSRIDRAALGFENVVSLALGMRGKSMWVLIDIKRADGLPLESELTQDIGDTAAWERRLSSLRAIECECEYPHPSITALESALLLPDGAERTDALISAHQMAVGIWCTDRFGPGSTTAYSFVEPAPQRVSHCIRLNIFASSNEPPPMYFDGWLKHVAAHIDLGRQPLKICMFDMTELGAPVLDYQLDKCIADRARTVEYLKDYRPEYDLARKYYLSMWRSLRQKLMDRYLLEYDVFMV